MLLSAHQPVYLPWLGLFHKIAVANFFIIYDDVPYSRFGFYNRNTILGANGPMQLSVPVQRTKTEGPNHCDMKIANSGNWQKKHWRSIQQAYQGFPHFDRYAPALAEVYERRWERLADLNISLLKLLLESLSIDTPMERASEHEFDGTKSDRALDMSVKLGAEALLFGALGEQYARVEDYQAAGIVPLFQNYVHPTYEQKGLRFRQNMSVIDLLFSNGPQAREILMSGNPTRADYLVEAGRLRRTWQ